MYMRAISVPTQSLESLAKDYEAFENSYDKICLKVLKYWNLGYSYKVFSQNLAKITNNWILTGRRKSQAQVAGLLFLYSSAHTIMQNHTRVQWYNAGTQSSLISKKLV